MSALKEALQQAREKHYEVIQKAHKKKLSHKVLTFDLSSGQRKNIQKMIEPFTGNAPSPEVINYQAGTNGR